MTNQLIDPFGRRIEYIRLSITDQCDLRCSYCLPKGFKDFQEPDNWLTFDEITRVIRIFSELGTQRIRLTGGEPLLRKNCDQLSRQLAALPGINDLSLSTNATRLEKFATPLKQAGVSRINVSLDTLQEKKYKTITGGGKLDKVIRGLMAAKQSGLQPIKINMVLMKDVNDNEIEDMIEFCLEHNFTLRFIEAMPMGDTGRNASQQYISLAEIQKQLSRRYELIDSIVHGAGPARYMRIANTELRIGFITPMSQHFCETCNRLRLSADGILYMCLGQEHHYELRPLLRAGIGDDELKQHIIRAIGLKPEKHDFNENPQKLVRFMSMTGG